MAVNAAKRTERAKVHADLAKDAAALILDTLNGSRDWDDDKMKDAAKILEAAGCYVRRNVCQ